MACADALPARYALCFMLFLGFMVVFLLRTNLNVAIVAMVAEREGSSGDSVDECTPPSVAVNRSIGVGPTPGLRSEKSKGGDFDWDEFQQSVILGSFFWGYLFFQVPGGRIAEVHGSKRILGLALLVNAVLCFFLPFAAKAHWTFLLLIRALQGLAQGVVMPSFNVLVVRWVPLAERARFMSFALQGVSLGTVVAMPVCAWIVTNWGWESVFYFSGAVTLVWTTAWWFLVFDTPDQHPRISPSERSYLEANLDPVAGTKEEEHVAVPWKDAMRCTQFWLGTLAAIGSDWGFQTFFTLGPKYMKDALGFDLQQSSWLASLPYLSKNIFALIYGTVADKMTKRHSLYMVRRLSVSVSHLGPTLGLVILALIGCNVTLSVVLLTLSVTMIGAVSPGHLQTPMDVAPNFAGLLTGVMNGMSSLTAVVSTPLAGAFLQSNGVFIGWRYIFFVAASMYFLCGLPYILLYKAEVQAWNKGSPKDRDKNSDLNKVSSLAPEHSKR